MKKKISEEIKAVRAIKREFQTSYQEFETPEQKEKRLKNNKVKKTRQLAKLNTSIKSTVKQMPTRKMKKIIENKANKAKLMEKMPLKDLQKKEMQRLSRFIGRGNRKSRRAQVQLNKLAIEVFEDKTEE